jgi:RNA-binding protein
MPLTGKQRRALRALGHHLSPVVQVGREGSTAAVIAAASQALQDHELIKVKVNEGGPKERRQVAEALAARTGSELCQLLGRTLLLYRRREDDPAIDLPGLPARPKNKAAPR